MAGTYRLPSSPATHRARGVPERRRRAGSGARRYGFTWNGAEFDWILRAYAKTGRMMPGGTASTLRSFDAVFLARRVPGVPDRSALGIV